MSFVERAIYERVCPFCEQAFTCANWQRSFCSESCREKHAYHQGKRALSGICATCGATFQLSYANQVTCSVACRAARLRQRERDRIRRSPQCVISRRERNRCWAVAHRNVVTRNPWLAGPPPYHTHLPGVSTPLVVHPMPVWPIELRNTRGLHGALTAILDRSHAARQPNFAIIPHARGWGVHWLHEDGARYVCTTVNGTLYDRPTSFTFGAAVRYRAPMVPKRGHQRVRLDTVTPVVIRTDGGARSCVRPTSASLQGTLAGDWLALLGLEYLRDRDLVRATAIDVRTQPARVDLGGKYGVVEGWEGSVELDVNAPARWLLIAAERLGMGSRRAFGFGRIRVTEVA